MSDHPDAVLLASLAQARPFSQAHYDQAVSLWDSVADEDPLPFVETCLRGLEGFAELADVWALLSCFFPRRTAQGALCVSRFDELLLTILSTEPQSPVSVFVHKIGGGLALRQLHPLVRWRLVSPEAAGSMGNPRFEPGRGTRAWPATGQPDAGVGVSYFRKRDAPPADRPRAPHRRAEPACRRNGGIWGRCALGVAR